MLVIFYEILADYNINQGSIHNTLGKKTLFLMEIQT